MRQLIPLLNEGVSFMAVTDQGETPLMHGEKLEPLLEKRIALMEAHLDDEPFIDPDYLFRKSGMPLD